MLTRHGQLGIGMVDGEGRRSVS